MLHNNNITIHTMLHNNNITIHTMLHNNNITILTFFAVKYDNQKYSRKDKIGINRVRIELT